MSRLYMKCDSDSRKTLLTTRGHKAINVGLFYGSRDNSKLACQVGIEWLQGVDVPTITIIMPKDIKYMTK